MAPDEGKELTRWARESIREALGGPEAEPPFGEWCERLGATFITLRAKDGELHGCVGSLEPRRRLLTDVRENAVAAALDDPRAPPLTLPQVDDLAVEVSLLSPLERLPVKDEQDAIAKLAGLRDGVVLRFHDRRATFLPQMWERIPDPEEFVVELKRKAGFAEDFWSDELEVWHYTVQKFASGRP
jgi:AmmeMemoRadiSam system protein A